MRHALPATFKIPAKPDFPDVTFLRVSPGPLPERYDVTLTPYDIARWARLHDDDSAWYRGESPWGGPVAMPWIMYFASMNILGHEFGRERHLEQITSRGGFARYRTEFLAPIPAGATVEVAGEVTDKYGKRGHGYVEWRLDTFFNGNIVQRHWKTWAFPATAAELAEWPDRSGEGRPADAIGGERFDGPSLEMTIDRLIEFEGPIPLNLHNNEGAAKALGLPGPVVQGELSFGLICRMLRDTFGPAFFTGGTVDVRFVRPVYAGQIVTAHGEVVSESAGIVECRVWAENQNSDVAVAGTATVKR